jgi:hypothetical protein
MHMIHLRNRGVGTRQHHPGCRATAELARDRDGASAHLRDAVGSRQSEAGALAHRLGGEERLEDATAGRFVHAGAIVAHSDLDVVSGRRKTDPGACCSSTRMLALDIVMTPPSGIASREFKTRLTSTCCSWTGSAETRATPAPIDISIRIEFGIRHSISSRVPDTTFATSSAVGVSADRREKASIDLVNAAQCSADVARSFKASWRRGSSPTRDCT